MMQHGLCQEHSHSSLMLTLDLEPLQTTYLTNSMKVQVKLSSLPEAALSDRRHKVHLILTAVMLQLWPPSC